MKLKFIFNKIKGYAMTKVQGGRPLSDLRVGEKATIHQIRLPEDDRRRMNVLGFAVGTEVFVSRTVPGGDPTVYEIDGNTVALRREAAMHVLVSESE